MNVLGKCKMTMELHGWKIQHQFIVTNVKEDAILGFDFLEEHQVRWNWTTRTLEVDQEQFPCKMGDMTTKVHRIITQQLSIIPPNSEMIVSGFVKDKIGHRTMGILARISSSHSSSNHEETEEQCAYSGYQCKPETRGNP